MSVTEAKISQLRNDVLKLQADIEHLGKTMGRAARAGVRDTREAARDAKKAIGANVSAAAGQIANVAEENPVVTALAVLGFGVLLGWICTGRRG